MVPAELITRRLITRLTTAGVSLPIESMLIQALAGVPKESQSSGVIVSVSNPDQLHEPLTTFSFDVTVRLVVSLDDDKTGQVFAENYEALYNGLIYLATGDNCGELGDANDTPQAGETITHVFSADGFRLAGGNDPDYDKDGNGGIWTTAFKAVLTGRAI